MMKTRLEEHYHAAVRPALMEKFGYKNTLEVPKIEKIIINMGVGEAVRDSKKIEHATRDLAAITGQKPVVTRAKRANAAFKLRAVGHQVTRIRGSSPTTATMPWVSRSRSCSRDRLRRLMKSAAWTSSFYLRTD